MKLSDIRLGVPLLRFETRIFHATPRKPTAFERVILGMTERFGQNGSFNNIPVERLFVDVLCVSDPGPLVIATLSELVALDVIRCMGDIEAPNTLILRDIEITERGQRMIAEDTLPAKSMQNEEMFYFDPIGQRLLSESESKAYRPVPQKLSIDSSVFDGIFPEEMIRSYIHSAGYRWFSSASHIERIESLSVKIIWKNMPCAIELLANNLKITSKDESLNGYLASIESNDSYARFIAPTFDHHNLSHEDLPKFDSEDLDQTGIDIQTIPQVLAEWPSGARLVIPGSDYDAEAIPAQAPAHQAIVLYHESHSSGQLSVEWNSDRSGCKLLVNATHPIPYSLLITDRENLLCRRINTSYGNEPRNIIIAARMPAPLGDDYLSDAVSNLSEFVKSIENRSDQNVLIFLQSESQILKDQAHRLADSMLPVDEIIQVYFSILSESQRLNGKVNRDAWLKGLWGILLGRIVALEEMDLKYFKQLFETLSTHGPYPTCMISELLGVISTCIKKPQSLDDLLKLTSVFRILDKDWSPAYPSELFTRDLTRLILVSFPDHLDPKLISAKNPLFNPLRALIQMSGNLTTMIGPNSLGELKNDDDYVSLIKSTNVSALSDIAHAWASEMDSLLSVLQDDTFLEGTRLAIFNSKIAEISTWTSKLIGTLDPRIQSVYVFDTSALIDQPKIVSEIYQSELFVVTKRVIEELDDKKRDETLRPNVTEVVRNLRSLKKEKIQFCDGDMSLLPPDYRFKGDNLILSVAVRYHRHNPVLITNDNNLSLKAQAEGLGAMTAEAFMKRPRLRTQKENKKKSSLSANPKSNQGKQRRKR